MTPEMSPDPSTPNKRHSKQAKAHRTSLKTHEASASSPQQHENDPIDHQAVFAKTHDGEPVRRTTFDPLNPHEPYVNAHGVVIGDNHYDSEHSPLNRWSDAVDPLIMADPDWVHPTRDIGWKTPENQVLLHEGDIPGSGPFSHPMEDVSTDAEADDLTPAEDHELDTLISRASAKKQKS